MYTWVTAADDLRSVVRFKVLKRASVLTSLRRHSVSLHDITSQGACISSSQTLSVGSDVFFEQGDLSIVACIKWAKGSKMGLQFYRELSEKEFKSVQLAKPSRFRWLRPTRLH
jgi:hypothetical protein